MPKDITEIEKQIGSFYSIISGRKDEARNWEAFKSLFTEKALLSIHGKTDGAVNSYGVEEYIMRLESFLKTRGFFEYSKSNAVKITGGISMVHNVYEAYGDSQKTQFIKEGNNYISLAQEGSSWKIVNMLWEDSKK